MSNTPRQNFLNLLSEVNLAFIKQLARIDCELRPHGSHSLGNRKPDLDRLEFLLTLEPEEEDLGE